MNPSLTPHDGAFAPFTIVDLPEPPRSVTFNSKQEAVAFAHDLLARVCDELVPAGALVIGGSQYQAGRRAVEDADIARRALEIAWPDMEPSAVHRAHAEDMARSVAWVLHDARAVLVEAVAVLRGLQFRSDDPAGVGRVLNAASRTVREIERRHGMQVERAAAEGAESAERERVMRERAGKASA